MHQFWRGSKHGLVTYTYHHTWPRLAKPDNINVQLTSLQYHVSFGQKTGWLVDRQHRNNNDASPIFESIPIGSAVVVQWEDSGPMGQ